MNSINGNVYDYLDSEAYRVLFDYGMYSFPLKIEELAKKLNADINKITNRQLCELHKYDLDKKLEDGCVIKENVYSYHIYINGQRNYQRIRFTIAHEIKHIIFDDCDNNEYDEKLTNHFAKILLAPPILLMHYDCKSCEDIVERFNVSKEVASYLLEMKRNREKVFGKNRIFDYEKLFYEEFVKNDLGGGV